MKKFNHSEAMDKPQNLRSLRTIIGMFNEKREKIE